MELETIIGLEIHVQLSSKSKLFSPSDNDAFGAEPNSRVHPIDMGFPGMLPVLNRTALKKAVRGAYALGGTIQRYSKFDRKNYFYPDLPCGYQITQFDEPISLGGAVEIEVGEGDAMYAKTINMTRVHLEVDAGKLTHSAKGTLCDYNRAGTPLAEIVTDPDMRSAEEAVALAKMIQQVMRYSGASSADMEKGMMRFDASVSMRPVGDAKLYPRAEIKNLNSFQSLGKAIAYQIKLQRKAWEAGTPSTGETTVGWLDDAEKTVLLRSKESANDYRYFPEPDLPPVQISEEELAAMLENMPEMPLVRKRRYVSEFGLTDEIAYVLTSTPEMAAFYDETIAHGVDQTKAANLIMSVLLAVTGWQKTEVRPVHVADAVKALEAGDISSSAAKEVLVVAMENGGDIEAIIDEKGLRQNNDTGQLEGWVDSVLAENTASVADFKAGKEKALQFLMGQVMKVSRGSANPPMVLKMLRDKLTT